MKIINKVLLIDDDETDCFLSKFLIEKSGLAKEIIIKENATHALEYLRNECYNEDNYPSLILVDLRMPLGNGFCFLEEFENLKIDRKHNITLVVLSYSEDGEDIIKLTNMGKYNLVSKPLTEDKFMDIYHRYFRKKVYSKRPPLIE